MQNELVSQWTETTKGSVQSWKEVSEAGMEEMSKMAAELVNLQNFVLMGKSAMEASSELRRSREHMLNTSLRSLIGMFPLEASVAIFRDFGAVYTDAVNRLTKQQTDWFKNYVDSVSTCLETLKKSRSAIDVMSAQMGYYTEVQQKTKENVVHTLMILEGVKTAVNAVVERTLEKMEVEEVLEKAS